MCKLHGCSFCAIQRMVAVERLQLLHRRVACAGWFHSGLEALYFWIYFVVTNGIWKVIPGKRRICSAVKHPA